MQLVLCCWHKFQGLYSLFGFCLSHQENMITSYHSECRSGGCLCLFLQCTLPVLCLPRLRAALGAVPLPAQAREVLLQPEDGVPNSTLILKKCVHQLEKTVHIRGRLVWKKSINICTRLDKFKWEDKHTFLTHGWLTVGRSCQEQ